MFFNAPSNPAGQIVLWTGENPVRGRMCRAPYCWVFGCRKDNDAQNHVDIVLFSKPAAPRLLLDFINRHRRSLLACVTGTRQRIEAEPPSVHPFLYGVSYGNYLLPYCLFLFIGQFDTYSCILFMYIMSNSIGFSKKCLKKTLL